MTLMRLLVASSLALEKGNSRAFNTLSLTFRKGTRAIDRVDCAILVPRRKTGVFTKTQRNAPLPMI